MQLLFELSCNATIIRTELKIVPVSLKKKRKQETVKSYMKCPLKHEFNIFFS